MSAATRRVIWRIVMAAVCAACTTQPRLMHGDAKGAQVEYDGNDLAAATVIAKAHCARFERVPRYLETALDIAWFDCVHP